MIEVVGTMFFINGKLLIDKPRKRETYQMIGGKVEAGETLLQAAIRECHEELGNKAIFDEAKFEYAFDFTSKTTSNPDLEMHMTIFKYNGILEGELSLSDEIENFLLFGVDSDYNLLSMALKNKIIPYCINNGLIKMIDFKKIKNDEPNEQEKYIKDITKLNVKLKVKKGVYHELL